MLNSTTLSTTCTPTSPARSEKRLFTSVQQFFAVSPPGTYLWLYNQSTNESTWSDTKERDCQFLESETRHTPSTRGPTNHHSLPLKEKSVAKMTEIEELVDVAAMTEKEVRPWPWPWLFLFCFTDEQKMAFYEEHRLQIPWHMTWEVGILLEKGRGASRVRDKIYDWLKSTAHDSARLLFFPRAFLPNLSWQCEWWTFWSNSRQHAANQQKRMIVAHSN